MLRHAQRVVVCLALVPSLRDLLDSPEGDRNVVAIVPANCDYRRAREPARNMQKSAISDNALDRTVALFFKVKSGIQGELLHRTRHIKNRTECSSESYLRTLPDAFRNAFVQRVLRGLYLFDVKRQRRQGQFHSHVAGDSLPMEQLAAL